MQITNWQIKPLEKATHQHTYTHTVCGTAGAQLGVPSAWSTRDRVKWRGTDVALAGGEGMKQPLCQRPERDGARRQGRGERVQERGERVQERGDGGERGEN